MKKQIVLLTGLVSSALILGENAQPTVGGAFREEDRPAWRITIAPEFNFHLKARMGVKMGKALELMPNVSLPSGGYTRQQVLDDITGASDPDGVKRYSGGAWINPSDSRQTSGTTWNYNVPSAESLIKEYVMSLVAEKQFKVASRAAATRISDGMDEDSFNAPGINLDVSRELFYDEDHRWGIDLAFGFSWFFKRNCIKDAGEFYTQRYDTETRTYVEDFDVGYLADEEGIGYNYDGSLGHGSFDEAGPILRLDMSSIREMLVNRDSVYHSLSYSIKGDYNEFEFMAALRPFWEPWDWLRLYGTLGLGMSYIHFSYKGYIYADGTQVARARGSEDNFDIYGITGLGAFIRYNQWILGADVNYRLFTSDVDIHSRYLHGSLDRAQLIGRVYFGLEF